jgi:hypothetical protein
MAKARQPGEGEPAGRRGRGRTDGRVRRELSSKHRRTLESIFEQPTRSDIPWRDIVRLFEALGAVVQTGSGSRRRVKLGDRKAVFHEPHPERVTDKGAVEHVRGFLLNAGVRP